VLTPNGYKGHTQIPISQLTETLQIIPLQNFFFEKQFGAGTSIYSNYDIFIRSIVVELTWFPNRPISLNPWSNAMNAFSNAGNISLWRSIRRVLCAWTQIDLGQLVQQFGGTAFGNFGMASNHKIIIKSISFSTSHH
jgi:hypothetical protein